MRTVAASSGITWAMETINPVLRALRTDLPTPSLTKGAAYSLRNARNASNVKLNFKTQIREKGGVHKGR